MATDTLQQRDAATARWLIEHTLDNWFTNVVANRLYLQGVNGRPLGLGPGMPINYRVLDETLTETMEQLASLLQQLRNLRGHEVERRRLLNEEDA